MSPPSQSRSQLFADVDRYRQKAEAAREMAVGCFDPSDAEAWHLVAQQWMRWAIDADLSLNSGGLNTVR